MPRERESEHGSGQGGSGGSGRGPISDSPAVRPRARGRRCGQQLLDTSGLARLHPALLAPILAEQHAGERACGRPEPAGLPSNPRPVGHVDGLHGLHAGAPSSFRPPPLRKLSHGAGRSTGFRLLYAQVYGQESNAPYPARSSSCFDLVIVQDPHDSHTMPFPPSTTGLSAAATVPLPPGAPRPRPTTPP